MFGKKKPTIFDAAQDKALNQLIKNQQVIIQNQNHATNRISRHCLTLHLTQWSTPLDQLSAYYR